MRRVFLLAGLAFLGLAAGSPQPQPVCGVCGGSLETAAERTTFEELTVERSTVAVRVHENGSATWQVRNRLDSRTAAAMREHPTARDRLVASAVARGVIDGAIRDLSTRIDGRTMHVRFSDPNAARRTPAGPLVADYFHTGGRDRWLVLTVDRFTVTGPSRVRNEPSGARIVDGDAVWTGNGSATRYDAPRIETDTYVVFGDGPATGLRTAVAVAAATVPIVWSVTTTYLLPPLGVAVIGLIAIDAGSRRLRPSRFGLDRRRVGTLVAGVGVIALAAFAVPGRVAFGSLPAELVGVGSVFLGIGLAARRPDAGFRALAVAGLVGAVVAGAAVPLTRPARFGVVAPRLLATGRLLVTETVRLAPLAVMAAAGWLAASGRRRDRLFAFGLVTTAFFAAELTVVWPTQRPWGLALFLLAAGALVVVLVGLPAFLLGWVTRTGSADDS